MGASRDGWGALEARGPSPPLPCAGVARAGPGAGVLGELPGTGTSGTCPWSRAVIPAGKPQTSQHGLKP